ncbi:MAG: alpha/beta fold hydrolase [Nitrospirae bacterium]|nr:alpha/beta fold hydrolase [Nitrospirota bacterium]
MFQLLASLVALVFGAAFVFVFLTYFIYLYEWANAPEEERKETDLLTLAFAFVREVFSTFAHFLMIPLSFLRLEGAFQLAHPRNPTPIVFVPGYLFPPSIFLYWRYRMKKEGWCRTYVVDLRPRRAPVEILAEAIMKKVEAIRRETGVSKVILVGHSLGALAAHYYIEKLGGKEAVERLVTICAPYEGSKLAFLAFGENARQMRYRSKFLGSLFRTGMQSSAPVLVCPTTPDNIIVPNTAALPPFQAKVHILRGSGHLGSLLSNELFEEIVRFARSGEQPVAAGPAPLVAAATPSQPGPSIS